MGAIWQVKLIIKQFESNHQPSTSSIHEIHIFFLFLLKKLTTLADTPKSIEHRIQSYLTVTECQVIYKDRKIFLTKIKVMKRFFFSF